ncbi:uncharacterized protein METZ01_LOCUS367268, partial [marine metagenome]
MKKLLPVISLFILMVAPSVTWSQDCTAADSTAGVELWDVCYSIETTTHIDIGWSGLTGEIPAEIGLLTNLTYLILSANELTGSIPTEIGNLNNLIELHLSNNQFTGSIPSEIDSLNYMNLENNQLTGEIPESICSISGYNIGNNQLCPPYPDCLNVDDWQLENQNLSNCEGDEFIELWGENYYIPTTTEINLEYNWIGGQIPSEIGLLTNLTDLRLSGNELTGEIPTELGNLDSLTY